MTPITDILAPVLKLWLTSAGRKRKPASQADFFIPDVTEKCEVIRDHFGVPHIYAANEHDLFFAQGFVHAQDRFFQMELNRRTANGSLSELVGAIALDTDRAVRIFGFNRLWKEDWENFSPEMRQIVEAYTQGVNAWMTDKSTRLRLNSNCWDVNRVPGRSMIRWRYHACLSGKWGVPGMARSSGQNSSRLLVKNMLRIGKLNILPEIHAP